MPKIKPIPDLTSEMIARFESKYIRNADNECWPWIASYDDNGYGKFYIDCVGYKAHRVALAIIGIRSDSLQVRHLCNNPTCVNPRHLRFGTAIEDAHDKRVAGTILSGSQHGRSVLIEEDIPIIRNLLTCLVQREVAIILNISRATIGMIKRGETWTHVIGIATNEETKRYVASI